MNDRDLIKKLWKLLKSDLWRGEYPSEEELVEVLTELRERGIEKARFLNEIK
jgi:hypothetical protein